MLQFWQIKNWIQQMYNLRDFTFMTRVLCRTARVTDWRTRRSGTRWTPSCLRVTTPRPAPSPGVCTTWPATRTTKAGVGRRSDSPGGTGRISRGMGMIGRGPNSNEFSCSTTANQNNTSNDTTRKNILFLDCKWLICVYVQKYRHLLIDMHFIDSL